MKDRLRHIETDNHQPVDTRFLSHVFRGMYFHQVTLDQVTSFVQDQADEAKEYNLGPYAGTRFGPEALKAVRNEVTRIYREVVYPHNVIDSSIQEKLKQLNNLSKMENGGKKNVFMSSSDIKSKINEVRKELEQLRAKEVQSDVLLPEKLQGHQN